MVSEFAKLITEIRTKHGMTQSEFAKRIGVSNCAVSSWERGDRTPTLSMINKISHTFDCDYTILASAKTGVLVEKAESVDRAEVLESIVKKVLEMEKQETPTQRKAIDLIKQLDDASIEVIIPMLERML